MKGVLRHERLHIWEELKRQLQDSQNESGSRQSATMHSSPERDVNKSRYYFGSILLIKIKGAFLLFISITVVSENCINVAKIGLEKDKNE